MPRTIPIPLLNHLQGKVLTTAVLITITRLDGVIIGLTSCNCNLLFNGITYEALDSMAASQLRQSATTGVDNLLVAGVLTSGRITDQDLLAGRYDGASLDLSIVNYTEVPLVNRALLVTGTLGEVTFADGQYQAEFRSLSQRLQQKVAALTSGTCRVKQLFDAECFVGGQNFQNTHVPSDFRFDNVAVMSVVDQQTVVFNIASGQGYYDSGQALWRTGANAGLAGEVKRSDLIGATMKLTFMLPWAFPVLVGDTALLEAGCDRTPPTCQNKFANIGNIRAEIWLPGNTRILRWGRR